MQSLKREIIKSTFSILVTIVLAISLVLAIAWRTLSEESKPNGFTRSFFKTELSLEKLIPKPSDAIQLESFYDNKLIFRTNKAGLLWVCPLNNEKLSYYDTILFPKHERAEWGYQYLIDSSNTIIVSGNVPLISFYESDPKKLNEFKFSNRTFTRITQISQFTFIARGFDSTIRTRDQVFIKENILTKERKMDSTIVPLNHDAGISTDGNLNFDKKTGLINFVSYYNNTLLALDTNLNVIYHKNTIDSFVNSRTEIGAIDEGKSLKYTNANAKRFSNTNNCVFNGILYNKSSIIADNEKRETFRENAVIDTYDVLTGNYLGSFYIAYYEGSHLLNFKVAEDTIVAQFTNHVGVYRIPQEITNRLYKE